MMDVDASFPMEDMLCVVIAVVNQTEKEDGDNVKDLGDGAGQQEGIDG